MNIKYKFIVGFIISVVGSILIILFPNMRIVGFALIITGGILQFLNVRK